MLWKQSFAARKVFFFAPDKKQFCFPDTNFASETYVSQFSHKLTTFQCRSLTNVSHWTASVQQRLTAKSKKVEEPQQVIENKEKEKNESDGTRRQSFIPMTLCKHRAYGMQIYINRDKIDVFYCQIDAEMSEK